MEPTRIAYRFAGRALSCATVLLVASGCAGIDDAINDHPVTGAPGDAGSAAPDSGTPAPCMLDELTPPAIVLTTSTGDQTGAQGSFCSNDDQRGCGVCADSARLVAKHFTIAHTGDQVTFSMPDGALVTPGPDQCQPACPPQIRVTSLCDKKVVSRAFNEDEAWTIDLSPGVYQLDASAFFSSDELHGQTDETFGLIIDDARERGIVEPGAPGTSCSGGVASP
jgi:hypothetical protein